MKLYTHGEIPSNKASLMPPGGSFCTLQHIHFMACSCEVLVCIENKKKGKLCISVVSLLCQLPVSPFRAIIIRNNEVIPMTNEFTPESERQRLQYLVFFMFYVTNIHLPLISRTQKYKSPKHTWLFSSRPVKKSVKMLQSFLFHIVKDIPGCWGWWNLRDSETSWCSVATACSAVEWVEGVSC